MSAAHTLGPWFMQRSGFSTVYIEARIGGGMLQEVAACGPTQEGSEQQDANACLIAAAPELLEALQELLTAADNLDPQSGVPVGYQRLLDAACAADAVIIKATGSAA